MIYRVLNSNKSAAPAGACDYLELYPALTALGDDGGKRKAREAGDIILGFKQDITNAGINKTQNWMRAAIFAGF